MRRKVLALMIVVLAPHFQSFAASGGSNRSKNPLGFSVSGHGQPAPSMVGGNLQWNVLSFFRVSGGVGYYDSAVGNTLRYGYDYTGRPLAWGAIHLVKP